MATQRALDEAYMGCAHSMAKLSHATRRKVGAILVGEDGIIAEGVNGTPCGFPNPTEDAYEYHVLKDNGVCIVCERCLRKWPGRCLPPKEQQDWETYGDCMVTKPECLHAESNAIAKIARSTNRSVGATLYCTLEPCFNCAKLMIQAGITRVVYAERYVGPSGGGGGPALLQRAEILVEKYDD